MLIAEDDAIIALELEAVFNDAGAAILGPCRSVRTALDTLANGRCDAAILDLRLGSEDATPIAEALKERGAPFLFYTGQSPSDPLLKAWSGYPVVAKPASGKALVAAVLGLFKTGDPH